MTKKLDVRTKDTRANLRMSATAIRESNAMSDALIKVGAGKQDSSTPLEYGDTTEVMRKHELSGLAAIHDGAFGDDYRCLFYRELNMMAQRVLRDSIRAELAELEKPEDDVLNNVLSDEEIGEIFGSEVRAMYTTTQACHWVMLTHTVGHAATMVTEADENGLKSKPCQWMSAHFRTVNQMLYGDMLYSITQSVGAQTAQLSKLDLDEAEIELSTERYTAAQKAVAMERFLTKKAIVDGLYSRDYYRDLETDAELVDLEDMIATLGLDVPALMVEVAQSYKDSKTKSARAGKYIGDIDERITALAPSITKVQRREAIAEAAAETEAAAEVVAEVKARKMTTIKGNRKANPAASDWKQSDMPMRPTLN